VNGPLVSVVVPVYNGEAFLAQAIEAIMDQDYQPIELLVADDGSTDTTPQIAARYPGVRYLRQDNAGPAAARNAGIAASTGQFVTFCDCDDLYHRGKVSAQVRYLQANPEVGCVLVRQRTVVQPGTEPPPWIDREDGGAQVQSAMVRRGVIEQVGGYNPDYRMSENMEWLGRIKTAGFRIDVMDDIVVDRRLHGTNLSYDRRELQRGLLASLRTRVRAGKESNVTAGNQAT
jgi:glycosyltransferase involved in cell wall biosynthesis